MWDVPKMLVDGYFNINLFVTKHLKKALEADDVDL